VTGTLSTSVRRRFVVRGLVQGVGFRPFVHALATELGLAGSVRNDTGGVVIEVEGPAAGLDRFAHRLRTDAPPLAQIADVAATDLPPTGASGFVIDHSRSSGGGRTAAAPDVATCADCLRELVAPTDRRYRHPFITCTNCGPRFTIITDLPYDRPVTTMARFPMCADCAREYADPADRRFHAQPIACPACGPRLEFLGPAGRRVTGEDALAAARGLLADGGVVAVKGLGGYHLACAATDEHAVATLRRRKRRGDKPFAVMVADLAAARDMAEIDDLEAALLTGPARPIVLVARRADVRAPVAAAVAPGNPDLGLLLPYTPVHHLLLGLPGDPPGPGPLVMTSGNLGGEPIAFDDADALERLAPLVDGWLRHDRPIHVPCDDSVVRVVDGAELPVRRSRGHAPLPVALPVEVPPTLAVGADLKNTCGLGSGRSAWLSGHIGDMDDLATLTAFATAERHLEHLTGVTPRYLVADAHPGYRSRAWAERHAEGRPLTTVQHHHAHVASAMAEHGLDGSRPVVGISFDGTGYGTDGAVWGGEVLVADYAGFRRFAHLAYVQLPGGDAAVRRPYRMALAHIRAAGVAWEDDLPPVAACPQAERDVLAHQLDSGLGCTPTSSMGRLFDAVSALLGIRQVVDFEAQAAIELENRSRGASPGDRAYAFAVQDRAPGEPLIADPAPVIRAVVADLRAGVPAGTAGARFHAAVEALVLVLAGRARRELGLRDVALTGGVFQNALLLASTSRALRDAGFTVLRHRQVPPGDGGLALGQLLVAAATRATVTR
jgi:hydrogenase maturation protein HypF